MLLRPVWLDRLPGRPVELVQPKLAELSQPKPVEFRQADRGLTVYPFLSPESPALRHRQPCYAPTHSRASLKSSVCSTPASDKVTGFELFLNPGAVT